MEPPGDPQRGSPGGNVANEPIAETARLSVDVSGSPFRLKAVEVSAVGISYGTPDGRAVIAIEFRPLLCSDI